jgi:hypothetical protein
MTPPRLLRVSLATLVGLAAVAAVAVGAAGPALASCAVAPDPVEAVNSAPILFVGKVTRVTNAGRTAEVSVLEVWRGPDQPQVVVVRGGPDGNAATSVDRTYEEGVTYLFFPFVAAGSTELQDTSCSNTAPYDNALSDLRPTDIRKPIGAVHDSDMDLSGLLPFGVAGLVFVVLLVVGLVARGREAD